MLGTQTRGASHRSPPRVIKKTKSKLSSIDSSLRGMGRGREASIGERHPRRSNPAGLNGKLWATFLPVEAPKTEGAKPRGVSLLMRDIQTVAVYDADGTFVGIRRPGSGKSIQASISSAH